MKMTGFCPKCSAKITLESQSGKIAFQNFKHAGKIQEKAPNEKDFRILADGYEIDSEEHLWELDRAIAALGRTPYLLHRHGDQLALYRSSQGFREIERGED